MTDRLEQRRNGFKAQIAMFVTADTPERREALDAFIMSLPLGAVLGITSLRVSGPALHVEVVPQLTEDNEEAKYMMGQISTMIGDAWSQVMEGDPAEIYWQTTVNEPLVDEGELDGMILPAEVKKILLANPTKD